MNKTYAFWNNKGGTGKTSLAFQSICSYAEQNPDSRILAIDLCPQANLSELFLGGLVGGGSNNLQGLQTLSPRKSVGGYFQARLPSPYSMPAIDVNDFICEPFAFNGAIPKNIDLFAGDALVELQANAITTLGNTQIPGTDTWLAIIDWLRDFMMLVEDKYDTVFIDTNPSFSIYTQIALASADLIILPVMADDSSRRAIQNAFSLVHDIGLPSPIYSAYSFASRLNKAGRTPPIVHLVVKNRLTQYMGPASAYHSVLTSIDKLISDSLVSHPGVFSFGKLGDGLTDIRDFQTTGVVAFAQGVPFNKLRVGRVQILGQEVQINAEYLSNCNEAINGLVAKL